MLSWRRALARRGGIGIKDVDDGDQELLPPVAAAGRRLIREIEKLPSGLSWTAVGKEFGISGCTVLGGPAGIGGL